MGPEEDANLLDLINALRTIALVQVDPDHRWESYRSHMLRLSLPTTPPFDEFVGWGRERQVEYMSRPGIIVEYYWLRVSFVYPVWSGHANSWYPNPAGYSRVRDEMEMLADEWPARARDVEKVLRSFGYRHMSRDEQAEEIPWLLTTDWSVLSDDEEDSIYDDLDVPLPRVPACLGQAVFELQ